MIGVASAASRKASATAHREDSAVLIPGRTVEINTHAKTVRNRMAVLPLRRPAMALKPLEVRGLIAVSAS
jgi:hypothetical protein